MAGVYYKVSDMIMAMKTLPREEADALWDKYWDEMHEEWFKLEVLQDYSAEDDSPSLRCWYRGDKQKSIEMLKASHNGEWIESCQEKLDQSVKLVRMHMVSKPYSSYIEWEIEHYKYVNIAKCGEDIYLLEKSDVNDLELPSGDLMIFDSRRAVLNTYNEFGLMTHETFYDETDNIEQFLELKKALKLRAKKLQT